MAYLFGILVFLSTSSFFFFENHFCLHFSASSCGYPYDHPHRNSFVFHAICLPYLCFHPTPSHRSAVFGYHCGACTYASFFSWLQAPYLPRPSQVLAHQSKVVCDVDAMKGCLCLRNYNLCQFWYWLTCRWQISETMLDTLFTNFVSPCIHFVGTTGRSSLFSVKAEAWTCNQSSYNS